MPEADDKNEYSIQALISPLERVILEDVRRLIAYRWGHFRLTVTNGVVSTCGLEMTKSPEILSKLQAPRTNRENP